MPLNLDKALERSRAQLRGQTLIPGAGGATLGMHQIDYPNHIMPTEEDLAVNTMFAQQQGESWDWQNPPRNEAGVALGPSGEELPYGAQQWKADGQPWYGGESRIAEWWKGMESRFTAPYDSQATYEEIPEVDGFGDRARQFMDNMTGLVQDGETFWDAFGMASEERKESPSMWSQILEWVTVVGKKASNAVDPSKFEAEDPGPVQQWMDSHGLNPANLINRGGRGATEILVTLMKLLETPAIGWKSMSAIKTHTNEMADLSSLPGLADEPWEIDEDAGWLERGAISMGNILKSQSTINFMVNQFRLGWGFLEGNITWDQRWKSFWDHQASSEIVYSAINEPMLRDQYLNRVRSGKPWMLVAAELQDPIANIVGEVIYDPLNFFDWIARAKGVLPLSRQALRRAEIAEFLPEVKKVIGAAGGDLDDVQTAVRAQAFVAAHMQGANDIARGINRAARYRGLQALTTSGKRAYYTSRVSNMFETIFRLTGRNPDDALEILVALARSTGTDADEVAKALEILSHAPNPKTLMSPYAVESGQFLRHMLMNEEGIIDTVGLMSDLRKAQKLEDGPARITELIRLAESRINQAVTKLMPSVDDAVEAGMDIPQWMRTAVKLDQQVGGRMRKINAFFAGIYMGWNPGYAFRNLITNTFQTWNDLGGAAGRRAFAGQISEIFNPGVYSASRIAEIGKWSGGLIPEAARLGFAGPISGIVDDIDKMSAPMARLSGNMEAAASAEIVLTAYRNTMKQAIAALPTDDLFAAGFTADDVGLLTRLMQERYANVDDAVEALRDARNSGGFRIGESMTQFDPSDVKYVEDLRIDGAIREVLQDATTQAQLRDGFGEILAALEEKANLIRSDVPGINKFFTNDEFLGREDIITVRNFVHEGYVRGDKAVVKTCRGLANMHAQDNMAASLDDLHRLASQINDPELLEQVNDLYNTYRTSRADDIAFVRYESEMLREGVHQVSTNLRRDLLDNVDDVRKAWTRHANRLGEVPTDTALLTKKNLLQTLWDDHFFNHSGMQWTAYRDTNVVQTSETFKDMLALVENRLDPDNLQAVLNLHSNALNDVETAIRWDNGVFTSQGYFELTPATKANMDSVRKLFNGNLDTLGYASKLATGENMDDITLLATINKWGPRGTEILGDDAEKFTRLWDVPYQDARFAINASVVDKGGEMVDLIFPHEAYGLLAPMDDRLRRLLMEGASVNPGGLRSTSARDAVEALLESRGVEYSRWMRAADDEAWLEMVLRDVERRQHVAAGLTSEDFKSMGYSDELSEALANDVLATSPKEIASARNKLYAVAKREGMSTRAIRKRVQAVLDNIGPHGEAVDFAQLQDEMKYLFDQMANRSAVRAEELFPPWDETGMSPPRYFHENRGVMQRTIERMENTAVNNFGQTRPIAYSDEADEALEAWRLSTKDKVDEARMISGRVATEKRNFILHDYRLKQVSDTVLQYIFPYEFWYRQTYQNWAKRALMPEHWSTIANYYKYKQMMAAEHATLPEWWKYSINSDELLGIETENPFLFNLEATLNPLNGITGVDFNDPKKRTGWLTATLDELGKFGPSTWTPYSIAIAFGLYLQGEKDAAARWGNRLIPQTATLKSLTALAGIGPPGGVELDPAVWFFSGGIDPHERNRVGRALGTLLEQGADPASVYDAAYFHEGELWDQARQMATTLRAPGQLASFFLGVGFKARSQTDMQIDQMYAKFFTLMQTRHNYSSDEFRIMMEGLRQEFPFMDVVLLSRKDGIMRDTTYTYNVLSRIPPGQSGDIAEWAGMNEEQFNEFYENKGFEGWEKKDVQRFMAGIIDIAAILEIPDSTSRGEWDAARGAYGGMNEKMQRMFGDDILDLIDEYFDLASDEYDRLPARVFMEDNPQIDMALRWKDAYILTNPVLGAYYASIDTIDRFYRSQMRDDLEQQLGPNMADLWATYSFLRDTGGDTRKFWNENPNLQRYMEIKEDWEELIAQKILEYGDKLPEGMAPFIRPEATVSSPQQGEILSGIQQQQQAPRVEIPFEVFQNLMSEDLLNALATNQDLSERERGELEQIATITGLEIAQVIAYFRQALENR